jgi:hypothetical protein
MTVLREKGVGILNYKGWEWYEMGYEPLIILM